jgi:GT2 family glycosyltransferase
MEITTARIAIVIVNWERPHDTIECIRSILASKESGIQIILVDNGSRDDSVEQIKQSYPDVHLVQLSRNIGFSGGYNEGIRYALISGSPFIFLLNNDTIIEPETLRELVNSKWDISVPKILHYDKPEIVWAAGARWRHFPPSVTMIGYDQKDNPSYDIPAQLDYATGCALMVKREVLEAVTGFDPAFENYMEDYDFSFRVRQAGFTLGYVPKAHVYHKVSKTLGSSSRLRWQYQGKNTVLFYRRTLKLPGSKLWIFLFWFTIREAVKGRAAILPGFWRGVKEGLEITRRMNRKHDGNHGLRSL